MIQKLTIAVLLTCHNRKDKTIQCLKALYIQQGLNGDFKLEVFLVDDASTDGTEEAIKKQFPEVNIIQGNGNLFWNRGMHLAWKTAVATRDFDYYLWLNDDTFLYENALQILLRDKFPDAIVCGTTQSQHDQKVTYGGYTNKPRKLIVPNGKYQKSDYCNGNCVLISREVFNKLGNLDPIFHHAVGDFDYSLRARKLGIEIYVAPDYVGTCESHDFVPKWQNTCLSWRNRLANLYTASSGCYPTEFFVFDKRHNGLLVACFHYLTIHLRAIVPSLWKFQSRKS
jgi:GT2 family glycosyltransferase